MGSREGSAFVEETITVPVRHHTRIVPARDVRFTCWQCGQEKTVRQFLGRPPRYCASCRDQVEQWRREDDRDAAAARMRRLRATRPAALLAAQPGPAPLPPPFVHNPG